MPKTNHSLSTARSSAPLESSVSESRSDLQMLDAFETWYARHRFGDLPEVSRLQLRAGFAGGWNAARSDSASRASASAPAPRAVRRSWLSSILNFGRAKH